MTLDALREAISVSGTSALAYIESRLHLVSALELRKLIVITHSNEPLQALGTTFDFFSPHQYTSVGAPYGSFGPFSLRKQVATKLRDAHNNLQRQLPGARLKIFDGYRPTSVQIFMRNICFQQAVVHLGLNPTDISSAEAVAAWNVVDTVWARPSDNLALPTPHSTGAAVDLTIVDRDGNELPMGSAIDEASERSLPSYYDHRSTPESLTYSTNRALLRNVMEEAGFIRLSHEWWHFSFGDQFWALIKSLQTGQEVDAQYGEWME